MKCFSSTSGIAIGPILFVIAVLGLLASMMAAGSGGFGVASVADRVTADVTTQINLIRSKLNECNILYGTNANGDGWPASDAAGTLVSALECEADPTGQKNLWSGVRASQLPPPTSGFAEWTYVNGGDEGGRCIWTAPTSGSTSKGVVSGLQRAATKFTAAELSYDGGSTTQKFVIFITRPQGTVDTHCTVP